MLSVEDYRRRVIADMNNMATFKKAWAIWEPQVERLTGKMGNAQKVLDLGSKLSEIFESTGQGGRGQDVLSAAGHAWEALVCWYLNAVFSGTRAVAVRPKKALVPACISDCSTVNYANDITNTESDLVVIVFPEEFDFPAKASIGALSDAISPKLHLFEVGIIQCKTNWNDNSQIPMLWDMVYRANGFKDHNLTVGKGGHSISDLGSFTYSFMTVPTQKGAFKPTDMAVKRVRNLSGGNFWGKPTQNGVALCASEIFNRNFKDAFDKPILQSIQDSIDQGQGRIRLI